MTITKIHHGRPYVSERQITNACIEYLERRNIPYLDFRRNIGILLKDKSSHVYFGRPKFSQKGRPDLILCFKGRFIAVEFKSAKGIVSEDQMAWLKNCRDHGGIVMIPRSIDEFIDGFEKLTNEPTF